MYNAAVIDSENRILAMGGDDLSGYGYSQTLRGISNLLTTEYLRETLYNSRQMNIFKIILECSMMTKKWHMKPSPKGSGDKKDVFVLDAP